MLQSLKCVLEYSKAVSPEEMVELEVDVAEFISSERVVCLFRGIEWFNGGTVHLKDYNAEKQSLVTLSNKVGVELLPRLLVWPDEIKYEKDESGVVIAEGFYFYQNLDQ